MTSPRTPHQPWPSQQPPVPRPPAGLPPDGLSPAGLPPVQAHPMPEHVGEAWYTNRMANKPAILRLSAGRLSLTVHEGVVFDERLADIDRIHVPWYWFSGGLVVTVRGRKQKIAFVRPDGAPGHDSGLLTLLRVTSLGAGVTSLATGASAFADVANAGRGAAALLAIAPGRQAGKTWRALLGV